MNKDKWFLNGGRGSGRTLRLLCETYENKIAELEKENAKLKEKNKWYSEQVCNKECAEVWGQLTKAKEIIKTFLAIANNDVEYVQDPKDCKDFWKELCEKAEQFINSEVEK